MSFYCNLTATGIDSIDRIYKITPATPVYGGPETHYTHIYGLDNFHSNFESVGCAFESHRGCLYVGVIAYFASANSGDKWQSKMWNYMGKWWSEIPARNPAESSRETWLWKLVDTTGSDQLYLSNDTGTVSDVKSTGNVSFVINK